MRKYRLYWALPAAGLYAHYTTCPDPIGKALATGRYPLPSNAKFFIAMGLKPIAIQ